MLIAKPLVCLLKVKGDRIMNACADVDGGKMFSEPIAVRDTNHVKMIDAPGVW